MALSARLQIRQTQSLVITPQLMQAIRLLQMPSLELERFVADEIERNPLLELADEAAPASAAGAEGESESGTEIAKAAEDVDAEPIDLFPERDAADFSAASQSASRSAISAAPATDFDLTETLPAEESLESRLERSIELAFGGEPDKRAIALALLGDLDEAGYLATPVSALAVRLGALPATVEDVRRHCQKLAPTGIFARDLAECLSLQLAERNRLDPVIATLLANLDRLAAGDRAGLAMLCGVDRDELDEMIAEVRALDPKPGLAFTHEPVRTLVPDVFVRPGPGGWRVELNDETLPKLIVNRRYYAEVATRCAGESDRRYLSDCLQKASWLEKSLDQRARTVLKVAVELVRRQEGFLADGVPYLKPLNLRMVADALGIHESTVSRAAANKTMATPRGIFEFRYFFTGAIAAASGGEAHSAEAVKHRIRQMIARESPAAVLSDDAIVAILAREGVAIARRTVAKYRELMRIGSSVERRREKRLRAAS
jgi:RNA polymerase sigma-54 factor